MGVPVLVRHDHGCRYARPDAGGHTDAARRLSDTYNLHQAAGAPAGWWFAVSLQDGSGGDELFPDRGTAVWYQHHNEHWCAFIKMGPAGMTVCQGESQLRWYRQAANLRLADRDDRRRGGRVVIPRLATEDQERQIAAMQGRVNLPVAIGYG